MHGGSARSKAARRTALGRDYSLVAGALFLIGVPLYRE